MKFNIVLEPEEKGWYSAYCPALPGCYSQGKTKQEALRNMKEAINGFIEALKKDHKKIKIKPVTPEIKTLEVAV